jgi:uncharacterized protein (TIGR03084 family)
VGSAGLVTPWAPVLDGSATAPTVIRHGVETSAGSRYGLDARQRRVRGLVRDDVFEDLAAEQAALDRVLTSLPQVRWSRPSRAVPWTVADVVLHLAQTEEFAAAASHGKAPSWRRYGDTVDAAMDALVRAESGAPPRVLLVRWRKACLASRVAMWQGDPERRLPWVASTVRPTTLATTRLAEHWAHALDITDALGIDYPETARLRHVAWLAHSTLPYAFRLAGQQPSPVYCELTSPAGVTWTFGDPAARSSITGPAAAFCRVAAQRLHPDDSGLVARGPHGGTALRVLRTYAVTNLEPG